MTVDGRGNVYVNTINFDFADFDDVLTSGRRRERSRSSRPDGDGPRGRQRDRVPERDGRSRRTTGP